MSSTPDSSQGSVLALLRASRPSLTASGQRIGELILAAPQDIVHLTVSDVAERTGASVGSVVRFCKDIGLRGFADLKLRLAAETNAAPHTVQGEGRDRRARRRRTMSRCQRKIVPGVTISRIAARRSAGTVPASSASHARSGHVKRG